MLTRVLCSFSSRSWWLAADQAAQDTTAVFSFTLKLPSREEACSYLFPFLSFLLWWEITYFLLRLDYRWQPMDREWWDFKHSSRNPSYLHLHNQSCEYSHWHPHMFSWHLVMCLWKDYRLTPTPDQTKRNNQTPRIWEWKATYGMIYYNILKPEYIHEQFSFSTWQLSHNGILMCHHAFRSQHTKNDLETILIKFWCFKMWFILFFPSAAL